MVHQKIMHSPIFRGVSPDEIKTLLERTSHSVKSFGKGQTIAQRNDEVHNLCIIVEGSVKGEMVDFSGKILKIEEMQAPMPIAHAFLFGERNRYPVDVVALEDCRILFIPKADFTRMMQQNATILSNYLNTIANRAQFLTNKLWFQSFKTIKGKIAHYILNLTQTAGSNTVTLPKSQQELAEFFGVTRPSLARVLAEMEDEGVITVNRRQITITDRKKLLEMIR